MRKLLFLLWIVCSGTVVASPDYYYALTPAAREVYTEVMALELDRAEAGIERLLREEPANLAAYHFGSYLDFFRLYLSGDEGMDEGLEARFDQRVEMLERGDSASPYYRYALAEVRLHRSLVDLRFERYISSFRHLNRAHRELRDNAAAFPAFLPTYKDLGLLHAAVGAIPPQYKWGVELFSSLRGSIEGGRSELKRSIRDTAGIFYRESAVLYALFELHLADQPELAYRQLRKLGLDPAANKLHCFVLASVAMRTGRNAEAMSLLEQRPRGGTAADFPYLDFLLAQTKLHNLDPRARLYYQSFLLRYPGRHFREEARQKIAWSYLLEGDTRQYYRTMAGIVGGSKGGGDENAVREAAAERAPHLGLLRARLLFDGGYFVRARAELDGIDQAGLSEEEILEHRYRTGRVLGGLKDYPGALSFYGRTIELGRDNPAYYACNAALQAGLLQEERGNTDSARKYFETCLEISPAEYRTGLHLMAKAGLDRLEN